MLSECVLKSLKITSQFEMCVAVHNYTLRFEWILQLEISFICDLNLCLHEILFYKDGRTLPIVCINTSLCESELNELVRNQFVL